MLNSKAILTLAAAAALVSGARGQTPIDLTSQFASGQSENLILTGSGASAALTLAAASTLSGWKASPALPDNTSNQSLLAHGRTLYSIGGQRGGTVTSDVLIATVAADGTIPAFAPAKNALPTARGLHGAAIYNNVIYVVGGDTPDLGMTTDSVVMSAIGADGQPGPWKDAAKLPEPRDWISVFAHKGTLYAIAGSSAGNLEGTPTTWAAPIHADGTLGDWQVAPPLDASTKRYGGAGFALGDRIWVAGGADFPNQATEIVTADVETASLDASGLPGAWASRQPLSDPRGYVNGAAVIAGGQVYLAGGQDINNQATNSVLTAGFDPDGQLTAWTAAPILPAARSRMAAAYAGGELIAAGGQDSSGNDHSDLFIGTMTPASPAAPSSYGVFESPVLDFGKPGGVGMLAWNAGMAAAGAVQFQYRFAPASGVFGPWSAPAMTSPVNETAQARYLQYRFVLTAAGGAAPSVSGLTRTPGMPPVTYGDVNGDGSVNVVDVVLALKIATKQVTATDQEILAGDVAPKPGANGQPFGDGKLDVQDAVRILRSVVKLDTLP